MRETQFIKQNKEKWWEFEQTLQLKQKDPEKLSNLFIQVTDDLSYSRTFYPNRSVRVYLNNISQRVFRNIYKTRHFRISSFVHFWTHSLPLTMWEARRASLVSFITFFLAVIIGVVSSYHDPDFPKVILGDAYVEMTKANIESGDPMNVYKDSSELEMWYRITENNLRVDILTFVMGIFAAIGSIIVLLYNGIMVGAFQYFFLEEGVFWESFLTIWMHGTLEMSAAVLAGAAGIVMGLGLVFPGTYSRMQSFLISARKGIKILIGLIPLTLAAGFIESFITRHNNTPPIVRGLFIAASLAFVLVYFWWLPRKRGREMKKKADHRDKLPMSSQSAIDFSQIKTAGEIFTDTFRMYGKVFYQIARFGLVFAVGFGLIFTFFFKHKFSFYYNYNTTIFSFGLYFKDAGVYFRFNETPLFYLLIGTMMLINTLLVVSAIVWKSDTGHRKGTYWQAIKYVLRKHWLKLSTIVLLGSAMLFFNSGWRWLMSILSFPLFTLVLTTAIIERVSLFKAVGRVWTILKGSWAGTYGSHLLACLICIIFLLLLSTPLLWYFFDGLQMNFNLTQESYESLYIFIVTFLSIMATNLLAPIVLFTHSLSYFSLREKAEATSLISRVKDFGIERSIRGIQKEA